MNTKDGFNIVNSTIISGKAAPVRVLYNNVQAATINIVNSVLMSSYSGKQIEINNNNPATYIGVRNSLIKGGYNKIEKLNSTSIDTGSLNTIYDIEPNFVNANNFNYLLSNNSPLIGLGSGATQILNNDTIFIPNKDLLSKNRPNPNGSNPDLGAYENNGGFPCPLITKVSGGNKKVVLNWT